MKKFLLPESGKYYKANMHCHSVLSDGRLTPEELKEAYKKQGYSVLAYTDHEKFIVHNDLTDADFLALNGYEIGFGSREGTVNHLKPCYHFNAWATDNGERQIVLPKPEYTDKDGVNRFIRQLNENGFKVCYNHPYWSLQTMDDYRSLEGLFAAEIFNYTCYHRVGIDGNQTQVYDTLLRLGKRLYCVATDDNHNKLPMDGPYNDSFGGFIMIKAGELTYPAIMAAIQKGDFYTSAGPAITELTIEDNKVTLKCSPAVRITLSTAGRHGGVVNAPEAETVTAADFDIDPTDIYFRLEVTDERGRRANTRAYFLDELYME